MIKVIIADDEVKVCQLIENLIDWKELGLEIVGVAHDGITALSMAKRLRPKIVITDIRMPGYDGIELIRRVKEVDKDIGVIIISGYRHFDYAHNAIKYGVEDYLLKPLKKSELTETLNKMLDGYRQKDNDLKEKSILKAQLKNDTEKLHSAFMAGLLSKYFLTESLSDINTQYHFKFTAGYFQVIILKPDIGYKNINENAFKLLLDKSESIVNRHLKDNCIDFAVYIANRNIYVLLNFDAELKKNLRKQFKAIIDEIVSLNDLFLDITATIGTGSIVKDISHFHQSLKEAEKAIRYRIVTGTGKIIDSKNIQDVNIKVSDFLASERINKFTSLIEILAENDIKNWISQICESVARNKYVTGEQILKISNNIIDFFLLTIKRNNFTLEDEASFLKNYYECIEECYSIQQVFGLLSDLILKEVNNIISMKKQADTKPIRQAKQYIHQNYSSPLTLEEVSGMVGFNPTYFSYIFKKETGLGFLEYLSTVRINKAKDLLTETDYSISEISEEVGYMDLKHFSKLFKKMVGLNPSEYRKIYK
ncbi:response regulator [Clostridium thermarum]|uniref:response regulator n=1 Tax=Clostridium thermarum TaxID=1716543 RepID=UPI0013D814C6|nr:response regulator [Clostridium thermarum]